MVKKKFFKKINNNKNKDEFKSYFESLSRIVPFSLILIFSFSILPGSINYIKENFKSNKIIVNASKQNFDKTLKETFSNENKNNKKFKEIIKDQFSWSIFDDIDVFGKDEDIIDPERLSASTIEQLFNNNGYNLKKVKKTKLVNIGNQVTQLPKELKNIQSVKKRKELFIKIVLPLVLEENTRIKIDRKKLFRILNKSNTTLADKKWLDIKFNLYGIKNKDITTLKIRMDEIPVSLAIAQAAKETGWGSSRFAQEGNALFGQWTWSGEGIKPASVDKNAKHKVAKFKILKASVEAYQRNLNTHPSYKKFRKERAIQRDSNEKLNSLDLVKYLDKYAETGIEYTKILKKIIEQNSLTDFDEVKILPTSLKIKNLI